MQKYPAESGSEFEKDDLLAKIMHSEVLLEEQFRPFLNEYYMNFELATGRIYSAADRAKLRKEKRPMFESNHFHDILLQLIGSFKGNMPGIEILGRTEGDHRKASMFRDINDYVLYTANDITYELAKAYLAAQIGRISWLKQEFNFISDEEGMIDIQYYNKFLKFDTSMTGRDLKECQYISDAAWYSPEELVQIYAKKKPDLADEIIEKSKWVLGEDSVNRRRLASWSDRVRNMTIDYSGENTGYDQIDTAFKNHGEWWNDKGRLKTVDWYERRRFATMEIFDRTTQTAYDISEAVRIKDNGKGWYDNAMLQTFKNQFPDHYIDEDETTRIYQETIIPALNLTPFDGPQQLNNGNFKFTMVMCFDFHPDVLKTKSLIDVIKDDVKSLNHRDNTLLTLLGRQAHGGTYIEKGAIKGRENQPNTIGGWTVVNDGAISKQRMKERTLPQLSPGIMQYIIMKQEEMQKKSAVTPASKGLSESKSEGQGLHAQKVAQSETMQEWTNENAQYANLQISQNNIYYIQNFFKTERVFRITQNERNPYWLIINQRVGDQILNDVSVGKYDVIVSKSPFGRMAKEIERTKQLQMIEILASIDPRLVDPKLVVEMFEPDRQDEWLKRVELVEGIRYEEMMRQIAADDLAMQTQQENQQLGTETQQLQNESTRLQNDKLGYEMGLEQLLQSIGNQ